MGTQSVLTITEVKTKLSADQINETLKSLDCPYYAQFGDFKQNESILFEPGDAYGKWDEEHFTTYIAHAIPDGECTIGFAGDYGQNSKYSIKNGTIVEIPMKPMGAYTDSETLANDFKKALEVISKKEIEMAHKEAVKTFENCTALLRFLDLYSITPFYEIEYEYDLQYVKGFDFSSKVLNTNIPTGQIGVFYQDDNYDSFDYVCEQFYEDLDADEFQELDIDVEEFDGQGIQDFLETYWANIPMPIKEHLLGCQAV
jgi:hypothetical protein